MHRIRTLGRSERVVLIVGLGVAVEAFCSYFVPLLTLPFAPSTSTVLTQAGPPGWFRVVVWIVLALGWAIVSIGILRAGPAKPPGPNRPTP